MELLKTCPKNDFKMREAILQSMGAVDLRSPLMNVIIEEIFKNSKDPRVETRGLCLSVLDGIRQRSHSKDVSCVLQGSVVNVSTSVNGGDHVYFKGKNILPFYYYFLEDPASKIREMASAFILEFGSQAELIFIEGMTRGQPLAKIECIRCLARLGVQNFRALILGLRDEDERVRRAATSAILEEFTSEEIASHFKAKEHSSISLLCNLKDVLGKGRMRKELRELIKEVILKL